MKILEQCKQCRKRLFCHWGEYEFWQIAHDNECPHFEQKQGLVPLMNFDRITGDPKILAEQLVYHHYDEFNGDEWFGVTGDGIRESFKTRDEAVIATLEWLGKEVEK